LQEKNYFYLAFRISEDGVVGYDWAEEEGVVHIVRMIQVLPMSHNALLST